MNTAPVGEGPTGEGPAGEGPAVLEDEAAWRALSDGAGFAAARDVVRLEGPEARSYLQGQCSQDVTSLAVGEAAWALVLSPQGKVDALARVVATGDDELVLDVDAGAGDALVARLARFRLRTKVTIERVGWEVVSVRRRGRPGDAVPSFPGVAAPPGGVAVTVAWPGWAGVDVLGPAGAGGGRRSWLPPGVPWVDPAVAEVGRIEAGVPRAGAEVGPRVIPAELGVVDRTVSFTKGCYTGQELVARLDARGSNVARHLRRLVVPGGRAGGGEGAALVGGTVCSAEGDEVGTVTSAGAVPGSGDVVALAFLHRRVAPPASVTVVAGNGPGAVGLPATALALPG